MPQNHISFLHALFGENEEPPRKRILRSIKAKANSKRTITERFADWLTSGFGSMTFLTANVLFFALWVLFNTDQISGVSAFDPFPFILLITIISLEAIILEISVLISQNRNAKIDELREEIDLQINLISQKEATKIIKMLALLLEKEGIDLSQDPELKKMIRPVSEAEIEKRLEKEILG
ncbi:hypothetical protein A2814_02530 [Candidatus Nomurabacteria bacterium RIFCSPHIGHO2_01_FULL_38_19]|uniref:DUF1003 domain-containing protein n=1 Tax=Candidatus Nomurabacteria bacterium RIFCSPHIGHO2_01_FULL_38_19 TaxID=1801732 RepID=A0A1F6URD4_9BACT|nr:MAG: hypothetical protein A2814_02530 [Candidatus Nomurabacteria bacterium RIFCSPHIGHO2_01_FULL_38_19]